MSSKLLTYLHTYLLNVSCFKVYVSVELKHKTAYFV